MPHRQPLSKFIRLRQATSHGLESQISEKSLDEIWEEGEDRAARKLDPGSSPG